MRTRITWMLAAAVTMAVAAAPAVPAQEPEPDVVAPVLHLPERVVVPATSDHDTVVTFEVSVTDDRDPAPTFRCYPSSGETFVIGDTTVHCDAADSAGNISSDSFVVHVQGAGEQLEALRTAVAGQPGIADGYRRKLLTRLDAASEKYATGDVEGLCRELRRFSRRLQQRKRSGLSSETAGSWTSDARRIGTLAGC